MTAGDSGDAILDVALRAAREAGALLQERFATGREEAVATKSSDTDLVSEADLAAERAIRAVLEAERPGDAILGEEGGDVAGTTGLRWIVDPLDGTVNFLFGIPHWCVSVCCEGRAGVVYDPMRDECFTVGADGVPRLDGRRLSGPEHDDLSTALVATGFGYDAEVRAEQAEVVRRVIPAARDIRRAGSAALDLAWCAAGRVDAYYEYGVQAWDTAAGELLCTGAGLVVERLPARGRRPAGILAAPRGLVEPLMKLVG